jgi:hypothetical protein
VNLARCRAYAKYERKRVSLRRMLDIRGFTIFFFEEFEMRCLRLDQYTG